MEFEVVGKVETTGTKLNSKGDEIEINVISFSLKEKRGKQAEGRAATGSLRCEGNTAFELEQGDIVEIKVSKKQKKLEG